MQRLSIKEKREFYSGMARLIRSGAAIPSALELLSRDAPPRLAAFLHDLNDRIKLGEPMGEAMLQQRPRVSELEAAIVSAAGRGGRLDKGCEQLSRYYDSLVRAQGEIYSRLAYPVVLLHLAALCINIEYLFNGGIFSYLLHMILPLLGVYALVALVWLGWHALIRAARENVTADLIARRIPGIGPIRERFALARFFATLDAQLEAGLNVWDAFANAARTSDSGRIIAAARKAMPDLQSGKTLSEILSDGKVIPVEYARSFRVAETAGELDDELPALAQRSEELAVAALSRWSEWFPRVSYTMVLLYVGWQIVHWYSGYLHNLDNIDLN